MNTRKVKSVLAAAGETRNGLSRRELLKCAVYGSVTGILASGCADKEKKASTPLLSREMSKDSPNILVFFCDQLRIDLLRCYGGSLVRTPNIDALAAESVVFERAYTPCAICSPARASLMTGLYPHGHHMFTNSTPPYSYCEHLRSDIQILPDWARRQTGYKTAYFGKWHIGPRQTFSTLDLTTPIPGRRKIPRFPSFQILTGIRINLWDAWSSLMGRELPGQ